MTGYKYAKEKIERYDIRLTGENYNRCMWATIIISEDGLFNAHADCGDFNYRWKAFGDCFKTFLINVDKEDYFYGKIAERSDFVDVKESINGVKNELLRRRKNRELEQSEALEVWNFLNSFAEEYEEISEDLFYEKVSRNYLVREVMPDVLDDCVNIELKPDNKAKAFCEVVMPAFVDILKKETQQ